MELFYVSLFVLLYTQYLHVGKGIAKRPVTSKNSLPVPPSGLQTSKHFLSFSRISFTLYIFNITPFDQQKRRMNTTIFKLRLGQVKTVCLFHLHLDISRVSLRTDMLHVSYINYNFTIFILSYSSTEKKRDKQHNDHQVEAVPTTAVIRQRQHPIQSTSLVQVSTSKNKPSRNLFDDSDNESYPGVDANEIYSQEINGIENIFFFQYV